MLAAKNSQNLVADAGDCRKIDGTDPADAPTSASWHRSHYQKNDDLLGCCPQLLNGFYSFRGSDSSRQVLLPLVKRLSQKAKPKKKTFSSSAT
jgi:hypothetical protein